MSTGTMPVAALAATLILALPAADAAAGAPATHKRDAALAPTQQAEPDDLAGRASDDAFIQLAALGGRTATTRRPKQPLPQVQAGRIHKPGAKLRATGPVPRSAVARAPLPPHRPTSEDLRTIALLPRVVPAAHAAAMPASTRAPHQTGIASYYSRRFNGRLMANGQRFDPHSDSIAHRSLPFGTRVHIVNMVNGRSVVGIVRDRGPYARGRLLDVSPRIARDLDMIHAGIVRVAVWHDRDGPVELAEAP